MPSVVTQALHARNARPETNTDMGEAVVYHHHEGFDGKPLEPTTQHCETTAKRCKSRKAPSSSRNTHSLKTGNMNFTTAKSDVKLVQCAMAVKA